MVEQPIFGNGRRCGFNSLAHFFFGVEDAVIWEITQTGSPLSLVIFVALLLEQKLLQNKTIGFNGRLVRDKDRTGLQFYTMKTIICAFSRYKGNSNWTPLEKDGLFCFHNTDFAVAYFQATHANARTSFSLSKAVDKIPSAVVFVLYQDHWTVFYNGKTTVPIPESKSEERRERVEFMANLFVNCVGSLLPGDAIASHILGEVMMEAKSYATVGYRTALPQGVSPTRFVWGIYEWLLNEKKVLNLNINEATQIITSYCLIDPTLSGFPINENYMAVLDPKFDKNRVFTHNEKAVVEKISSGYTNLLSHKPVNRVIFANKKPSDFNVEFYCRVSGAFTLLGKSKLSVTLDQALNNSSTGQTVDRFSHIRSFYKEIFAKLPEGGIETYYNLGVGKGVEPHPEDNTDFEKLFLYGCFETALSFYLATGERLEFGNTPVSFVKASDPQGKAVVVKKTVAGVLKAIVDGIAIEM